MVNFHGNVPGSVQFIIHVRLGLPSAIAVTAKIKDLRIVAVMILINAKETDLFGERRVQLQPSNS